MEKKCYIEGYRGTGRLVFFNVALLSDMAIKRFMDNYEKATKNGVDPIDFVNTWNKFATDICEHVFIKIPEAKL